MTRPKKRVSVLDELAERERLKITRGECNERIIEGPCGEIFDPGYNRLHVLLMRRPNAYAKNRLLRLCDPNVKPENLLKPGEGCGPVCHCEGDSEAQFNCRLEDTEFLRLAIHLLQIRRKRRTSPEQLQKLQQGWRRWYLVTHGDPPPTR